MKPKFIILILTLCCLFRANAQIPSNNYAPFYPIGDDPNFRLMTSYIKQEKILFDVNPIVRLGVFNNFIKGLMNNKKHMQAWYISVRPQFRIYNGNSLPVKTPSYRGFLATQHLFRLPGYLTEENKEHFIGISIESGHYSNGENFCAFSKKIEDNSKACDSIYGLINSSTNLSDILNRGSGNFSTNLTEIIFNYRNYRLNKANIPKSMHSVNLGYILYHNKFLGFGSFGGYSADDIKIYGRHRFLLMYEYMLVLKQGRGSRFSFKQNIELIQGAHPSVNPLRSETIVAYYPFVNSKALGIFITYIYGHDNYNFRFVDSGHQASIGFTWNQFPPFPLTNKIQKDQNKGDTK